MDGAESDRATILLRQRKAFADFGCYALRETDLDKVLTEAARLCVEGLGVSFAKVLEYRPAQQDLVVRAGIGWQPHVIGRAIARVEMSDPSGRTVLTGNPVVIADVNEIGIYNLPSIYPEHHIKSAVNVAINGGGERNYGVLEADSQQGNRFTADDVAFLQNYANVIAGAVINIERIKALHKANDALVDVSREQQHRMRNNLQSIAAHISLNADGAEPDARQRSDALERHVFALASLYEHLIGAELATRVDLAAYLLTLFDRLRVWLEMDARPITLVPRIEAAAFPSVDADVATALGTAVNELVANAVEHAFDRRGGTIELRLATDAQGRIIVEVADDGCGFGDGKTANLGLAIVRRLVARAGANLTLDSTAGRTVWTMALPAR